MPEEAILQPQRVVVGNCPECGRLFVIPNNHETWPPARCSCGWVDGLDGLIHRHRQERIMPWDMP